MDPHHLVILRVVLGVGPVAPVAGEDSWRLDEVAHQGAAEAALRDAPLLVEAAPEIARRSRRAKLDQVAASRRKEAGRVRVLLLGKST